MRALIPYLDLPLLELGPVVLDSWAVLVSLGFILGLEIARARGIARGLDVRDVVDGAVVTVGVGFLVGHLVHVLAYNPQRLETEGMAALYKVWTGFSSTGGFIGAVIGSAVFFKLVRKVDYWAHADAIVFGFPVGWTLGRLGCFTAHDHIGRESDFWLAVAFPNGSRHDLGLYEALWSAAIALVFFALRKRDLRPGFFLALFALLYAPIRFLLDFLRNQDLDGADVRWAGLTPAQYGMVAMFLAAGVVLLRLRKRTEEEGAGAPAAPPSAPG
jgi:phosphatidylglycerol---prolipoprotein diacylglyceryl transferase